MKLPSSNKKDSDVNRKDLELEQFMKEIGNPMPRGDERRSLSDSNEVIPISSQESYFLFDLVQNNIVEQKGMAGLLGLDKKEIDLSDVLEHIHEEDSEDVSTILKEVFAQLIEARIPIGSSYLKMSFHIEAGNGEKLGIISDNIVYSNDMQGRPISVLVKFLKADFMKPSMTVGWWVDSGYLDRKGIERSLYREGINLFTPREYEILQLIFSNRSSAEIAEALCLSEHTIVTHKKNIFAKTNCHSLEELKEFCVKNRIF